MSNAFDSELYVQLLAEAAADFARAAVVQEQATAQPGLYFVAGPDGIHIESLQAGWSDEPEWFVIGSDVGSPEPIGPVLSGPHTCDDLLGAIWR